MSAEPLIQIEDLHRHFRMGEQTIRALDGVSFEVEPGEMLAIVGSSGSGKTTLMNVLGCLDGPTRGRYRLAGRDVQDLSDDALSEVRNRRIGFVFQSFQLMARATAERNVELPLIYRGIPVRRRRQMSRTALSRVGLSGRARHRPNQLSGGQRQRVAIARALVGNPTMLLADEPTGNLDSGTEEEIMALFGELNEAGHTILIVTHEPSVAARCRRAIRLADGRIVADGPGPAVAGQVAEASLG